MLPSMFENMIIYTSDVHDYYTRQNDLLYIQYAPTKRSQRTIKYYGTKLWNIISGIIQPDCAIRTFKQKLKIFLLSWLGSFSFWWICCSHELGAHKSLLLPPLSRLWLTLLCSTIWRFFVMYHVLALLIIWIWFLYNFDNKHTFIIVKYDIANLGVVNWLKPTTYVNPGLLSNGLLSHQKKWKRTVTRIELSHSD